MTPNHQELWVVEDGMSQPEGPPGNARIRRFQITTTHQETTALDLTPWR